MILLDTLDEADWIKTVTLARHGSLDTISGLREPSRRHYGPGPHKSGTPQSVHGANFGDTVHPTTGKRPTTGYQVGQPTGSMIVPRPQWQADNGVGASLAFIERNRAVFDASPDVYMGVWLDKAKQEIDLDVSHNIQDLDAAVDQARQWDQQAIWDNVRGQVIMVGGTGARDYAEGGRATPAGVLGLDRGREARMGGDPDARGAGGPVRRVGRRDPEVVEALERFYRGYDPNQPRRPDGKWGTISPGVQAPAPSLGRVENPVDGPDGTDWGSLDARQQAKMQKANDKLGIPDVDAMEGNLTDMVAVIPPGGMEGGRQWWQDAQRRTGEMAEERDGDLRTLTHEQSAAMTAAMSPQCRWETNLVWADHVTYIVRRDPVIDDAFLDQEFSVGGVTRRIRDDLPGLAAGRRFSEYDRDTQSWLAIRSGQKPMTAVSVAGPDKGQTINANAMMGTSVRSALDIAYASRGDAAGITEHLGGHKTRSFYDNMLTGGGPPGVVTIDVHASDAAWLGISSHAPVAGHDEYQGASATDTQRKALTNGSTVTAGVKGTAYAPTAEAYRRVTATYNAEHGTDYTVADMQAAVWLLTIDGN